MLQLLHSGLMALKRRLNHLRRMLLALCELFKLDRILLLLLKQLLILHRSLLCLLRELLDKLLAMSKLLVYLRVGLHLMHGFSSRNS